MKPSEKRDKKILNLLNKYDYGTRGLDAFMAEAPDKLKMNPVTLKENINRLDIEKNHLCYIHVIYNQDINGNYKVRTFGTVEWLTSNGKDYLDDLNHSWERTFWLYFQIYGWPIAVAVIVQVIKNLLN